MPEPRQTILLGPPGTGKTTRLLDILDRELTSGTRPDRIAFVSFTKKAVEEARDRAASRFGFVKEDMPWFRTLHSLAFSRLGLRRDEVMQPKNYREIGAALGLTFSNKADALEEGLPQGKNLGDRYTFLDGYARARGLSATDAWRQCCDDEELNEFEFKRFRSTLSDYKRQRGMLDFTDMLEYQQAPIDVDVVIVDEAQDLSTLQWEFFRRVVAPGAARVYVAGDDDQAIYQWSGADVTHFQDLLGDREVLHQSHRVPRAIHKVANRIVGNIIARWPKDYAPKDEEGLVRYHMEPDTVDLDEPGTWLLLARNVHLLPQLVSMVRSQGRTYLFRGESVVDQNHIKAIETWGRWRQGQEPSDENRELVNKYLASRDVWPDTKWHEALVKIPRLDREWYLSIWRRGGSITKKPRINISTIHAVKGGEADHVMLLTDMSARTWGAMQLNPAAEHRVWYVGATRARQSLDIVQAQGRMFYDV